LSRTPLGNLLTLKKKKPLMKSLLLMIPLLKLPPLRNSSSEERCENAKQV